VSTLKRGATLLQPDGAMIAIHPRLDHAIAKT
jgi:hypothetical protein